MRTIIPVSAGGASERLSLKQDYLACLRSLTAGADSLRSVVNRLRALGVGRRTLIRWALEAGYAERYIRSLLSQIFAKAGLRMRKPGAGPKTPQEALELLAIATDRYGERAERLLRAAARAAKRRREALMAQTPVAFGSAPGQSSGLLISYTNKPSLPGCSTLTA
jgi:hypothetical protein